jgi:hypothetical protein
VLQEGQDIERAASRTRGFDNRLWSDWSQIQRELRFISDVYGFRYNGGGYGRDDRNDRNRNSNDDWWRRIPFPQ